MQDTGVVGRLSGTTAQAALHPAVAVLNYSAKLLVSYDLQAIEILASTSRISIHNYRVVALCLFISNYCVV